MPICIKSRIRIGDVPLEEIYPYLPDRPLDVYIRDLIVDQTVGQEKATHHGQCILAELTQVFTKLGTRGVNIRAIYALTTLPQGNRLAKKLGFRAMTELDNETEGSMPYELIVKASDSPLINEYKTELQRYLERAKSLAPVAANGTTPTKSKGKKQQI